jgi:hypothetical protein
VCGRALTQNKKVDHWNLWNSSPDLNLQVQWSKMTSQLSSTYDVTAHIDSREINILDLLLIQLQHV